MAQPARRSKTQLKKKQTPSERKSGGAFYGKKTLSQENYMGKGKRMRKMERESQFWKGVKACAVWLGGTLLGTAAFLYYVLEIVEKLR